MVLDPRLTRVGRLMMSATAGTVSMPQADRTTSNFPSFLLLLVILRILYFLCSEPPRVRILV